MLSPVAVPCPEGSTTWQRTRVTVLVQPSSWSNWPRKITSCPNPRWKQGIWWDDMMGPHWWKICTKSPVQQKLLTWIFQLEKLRNHEMICRRFFATFPYFPMKQKPHETPKKDHLLGKKENFHWCNKLWRFINKLFTFQAFNFPTQTVRRPGLFGSLCCSWWLVAGGTT